MEYQVRAELSDSLSPFLRAYLEAAEWSGIDSEQEEAFDLAAGPIRWTEESLGQAQADCLAFLGAHAADIGDRESQAGHDFWLTRNGHGAGFWDGDWPDEVGRRLTDAAHVYGSVNVWFDEETETLSF